MMLAAPIQKLLVLDYDETLTNKHVHNELFLILRDMAGLHSQRTGEYLPTFLERKDYLDQYLKTLLIPENIKNGAHIANMLVEAHEKGVAVGVASFTWFEFVVIPTLKFILEQAQVDSSTISDILESVEVVVGYPSEQGPVIGSGNPRHEQAKQGHILELMKRFGIEDNTSVCLLDDSSANCLKAREAGHQAVEVPKEKNPDPSYFNQLDKFLMTAEEEADYNMLRQATDALRNDDFSDDDDYFNQDDCVIVSECAEGLQRLSLSSSQGITPAFDNFATENTQELNFNPLSCSAELRRSEDESFTTFKTISL